MHSRWLSRVAVLGVFSMVAAACGSNTSTPASGGGGTCDPSVKVGLALDVGGIGDKSFNDAANRGAQKAVTDGLICKDSLKLIEPNATGSNRDDNVQALADQGYNLAVGVGFSFSPGISDIAAQYPTQNFAVIDGYATCGKACGLPNPPPNVADLTFKEQEGSFLVGAAAAIKCQCDTIGFLGGETGPLIGKFEAGYEAGAKYINPSIKILVQYIGDDVTAFNDPTKGQALSQQMFDDGAKVIYHASGASGAGLFTAVADKAPDVYAIGVDSDQYLTASADQQPHILTSMLKRVDTAVYNAIKDTVAGTFKGGAQVFGLAENGVDFATSNPDALTQDIVDQLNALKQKIISGDIVVSDKP
ncbi:MAG: BMP family ABC transporter substrate-binding protein [Actinobacteria bacterium]|nr:BMP family ABC transporter substrate-binding protein [Actinomycetota bacterium]